MTVDQGQMPRLLRLCLDLNIWIADFLSTRRGRRHGSSSWLIDSVVSAACPAGSVQLVISFGMLERLAVVLARDFEVSAAAVQALVHSISNSAEFGPAGDYPHLVLGPAVYPLRDEEDRQVLEVAVAGHADVLVTANLQDFEMYDIEKVGDGSRVRLFFPPGRAALVIAHPDEVCRWLRDGVMPTAATARGVT